MKILNLIVLALIMSSMSCKKDVVNPSKAVSASETAALPSCVDKLIAELKNRESKNVPVTVSQYEFKGQTVFYVSAKYPDDYGTVYNQNCEVICHPDGGITGRGDGKCTGFFEEAKNQKIVWQEQK